MIYVRHRINTSMSTSLCGMIGTRTQQVNLSTFSHQASLITTITIPVSEEGIEPSTHNWERPSGRESNPSRQTLEEKYLILLYYNIRTFALLAKT